MPDDFEASFDYRCVAFLDILGFGSLVESDASAPSPAHLPRILECLKLVQDMIDDETLDADIQTFSDSVVISTAFDPSSFCDILDLVIALQRGFVSRHLCLRGGIAFGRHYDDGRVLYSGGLVSAYRIESQTAKVPRVVVEHNLLDLMKGHPDIQPAHHDRISSALLQDRDGQAFVNYLDGDHLADHKVVTVAMGAESRRSGAATLLEKYLWLLDYHNHIASGAGADGLVISEPEDSFNPV
jgi:hypothetical protein